MPRWGWRAAWCEEGRRQCRGGTLSGREQERLRKGSRRQGCREIQLTEVGKGAVTQKGEKAEWREVRE